jgi:mannose-6-phosphate isomerase-like protein (cupin superfamily)
MAPQFRRIVTGHNAKGKSIVVIDGPATPFGAYWQTERAPADNSTTADAAQAVRTLEPAPSGSIFRYAVIPPEDPNVSAQEREAAIARGFAQMGAEHCRPDTSRDPGMHKTRTVDYVILLSGEVTLLLDDGEVNLKPFDVVVQRGTNHAWINKGKEPAIIGAVLIDARKL